jgi:Maintenance of mitochondrial structure and function
VNYDYAKLNGVVVRIRHLSCDLYLFLLIVDLLVSAASQSPGSTITQPITDIEALEKAIQAITSMLDRVLTYVRSVLSGEVKGDPAVGRYLMDTFGASTDELEKGGFNASLQVCYTKSGISCDSWSDCSLFLGHANGVIPSQSCPIPS